MLRVCTILRIREGEKTKLGVCTILRIREGEKTKLRMCTILKIREGEKTMLWMCTILRIREGEKTMLGVCTIMSNREGVICLLNSISTPYGLFNAKIWLIYEYLIVIITNIFFILLIYELYQIVIGNFLKSLNRYWNICLHAKITKNENNEWFLIKQKYLKMCLFLPTPMCIHVYESRGEVTITAEENGLSQIEILHTIVHVSLHAITLRKGMGKIWLVGRLGLRHINLHKLIKSKFYLGKYKRKLIFLTMAGQRV